MEFYVEKHIYFWSTYNAYCMPKMHSKVHSTSKRLQKIKSEIHFSLKQRRLKVLIIEEKGITKTILIVLYPLYYQLLFLKQHSRIRSAWAGWEKKEYVFAIWFCENFQGVPRCLQLLLTDAHQAGLSSCTHNSTESTGEKKRWKKLLGQDNHSLIKKAKSSCWGKAK